MAVTFFGAFIASEQLVPVQSPLYPLKLDPASAVAVKETAVPVGKENWQAEPPVPQSILAGLEVTLPVATPPFGLTLSSWELGLQELGLPMFCKIRQASCFRAL